MSVRIWHDPANAGLLAAASEQAFRDLAAAERAAGIELDEDRTAIAILARGMLLALAGPEWAAAALSAGWHFGGPEGFATAVLRQRQWMREHPARVAGEPEP